MNGLSTMDVAVPEVPAWSRQRRTPAFLAGTVLAVTLGAAPALQAAPAIEIPVRFHVADTLVMEKDGRPLDSWVTERQIRGTVVPEVNRIWRAADIRFVVEGVRSARPLNPPDRRGLIEAIAQARRNDDGESDPDRIRHLGQLIDVESGARAGVDVYLVPYLGEASQGNTKRRLRRIFVGQWTDKSSHGRHAPERFALIESGPFVRGSLSRTVAHELGHVLGLSHPDKQGNTRTGLLMGGRQPGYDLTAAQIETARQVAAQLQAGP